MEEIFGFSFRWRSKSWRERKPFSTVAWSNQARELIKDSSIQVPRSEVRNCASLINIHPAKKVLTII